MTRSIQRATKRGRLHRRSSLGFTLIELLVVVSIIALLISILLPSLTQARKQAKSVVCLSNLKSLGGGVLTYAADFNDRLPGPLHPAVYKYQTDQAYRDFFEPDPSLEWIQFLRSRQLTWKLHTALGQKAQGLKKNIADDIATCPVLQALIPDEHFADSEGAIGHFVFPTHYALNNYGSWLDTGDGVGTRGSARPTNPMYYFGYSPAQLPSGWSAELQRLVRENPPRPTSQIKRAQEEWMIADAWWRENVAAGLEAYQQEGPYQSSWSGAPYPAFAPHFKRGSRAVPMDTDARRELARRIKASKQDGKTNTVFFDGHASSERSKELWDGEFPILYGFKGTVNVPPDKDLASEYGWVWK